MLVNMNKVLYPAKEGKYGVGLFNAVNLEMARGIIEAAEETNSPVIFGTAESLFPYGPLEMITPFLREMAEKASVPVVLHLDHGLKKETCLKALELGCSSIMYDCSKDPYEENVKKTAEMAEIAHEYGATIEAELGHVGSNEGTDVLTDPSAYYTDPDQALDFAERTKVDALAIAVGTAHGAYKFPPKLDFGRIEKIAGMLDIPLVLHGGSGLSDDDFIHAIASGISKVNIFTDINVAAARGAIEHYKPGMGLTDLVLCEIAALKEETIRKMKLFGCCQKA